MKLSIKNIDEITAVERHHNCGGDAPRTRTYNPLFLQPALNSMTRAYLRDLRAAEMTAWELSGGDYLRST